MTKYREILRLKSLGFSDRNIAQSCGVSRNTVRRVIDKAEEMKISWPLDFGMTDAALGELLFPTEKSVTDRRLPDYSYIRKELLRNGVTKKLLWVEYCEECRQTGEDPLMYSQFCEYIRRDEQKRRATMHIPRSPENRSKWAGQAIPRTSPMLVADNCATAVDHVKSDWYTPVLNTTYHEMAEHYNVAILPARVRRPKDKPNVEGSVGKISTWITAALRNEQFFSLAELNAAIREKRKAYNARQFQKKECSRLSLFLGEEQPFLAPLPAAPFEPAEWKQATVQFNYHIAVDGMYYSVPYQYIKNKVDVRVTDTTIEVFYNHDRIASLCRLHGRAGQYSTVREHMPDDHQKYLEWTGDRFRSQRNDPAMKEVSFDDRFGMLVDIEYSSRKNNRLKRLIRMAEFEQPDASVAAIDYHSGRKLNRTLIERMANCEYITEYWNIFITGATGSGKLSVRTEEVYQARAADH